LARSVVESAIIKLGIDPSRAAPFVV